MGGGAEGQNLMMLSLEGILLNIRGYRLTIAGGLQQKLIKLRVILSYKLGAAPCGSGSATKVPERIV
jgi:hypothetical protein